MTISNSNKYTLGIYNSNTAGVALFRGGELIYASSEERFTRTKQQSGMPINALFDMVKYSGVHLDQIYDVAYGGYNYPNIESIRDYIDFAITKKNTKIAERIENSLRVDAQYLRDFCLNVKALLPKADISFVDHHESHAFAAYAFAGKKEINILTADGRGDLQSSAIWRANEAGLTRHKTFCEFKSLGFFYGQITKALGFVPYRHEGKITGLAAIGKRTDLVEKLKEYICFKNGDICVSDNFQPFNRPDDMNWLLSAIDSYTKEDVAFAAQNVLEETVLNLIEYYFSKDLPLAVAGGIFGNVKLNQRIRESNLVNGLYVFPEMSDGGLCVGAAACLIAKNNSLKVFGAESKSSFYYHVPNMYLGNFVEWNYDYTNLNLKKISFENKENFLDAVVQKLIENNLVGVVSGRMEFGPRALGGRSIIFSAVGGLSSDLVNQRFDRTEFMPFAPVTLKSQAKNMYPDYKDSDVNVNYMTICYNCSDEMRKLTPLVVHVDNTARPQIIDENHPNKVYYQILNAYYLETGVPTLVNTSFNRHEEPIVCTSLDALKALKDGLVDLVINDKYEIYIKE